MKYVETNEKEREILNKCCSVELEMLYFLE
mgnify:CR=1 FL=1